MGMFKKPPPFRIVLNSGERPRGMLGGSLSGYVPPGAQYDYKPPSVFARYKWLSLAFVALILSIVIYFLLVPRAPRIIPASHPAPAPASEPVYVEPLAPTKR